MRHLIRRRTLRLLLVCAGTTACTSVRPVQPSEFIPSHAPDMVWVTYADQRVVEVEQPAVVADTLRGTLRGTSDSISIPLGQVQSVKARTPDPTKTAVLATTAGAGAIATVYLLCISQAGSNTAGVYCGVDEDARPIPYC